jgi:hypothetical protein
MSTKKNKQRKRAKRKKVVSKRARPKKKLAKRTPRRKARSGGRSGDSQQLSSKAGADSESVEELLEEGNAFEAEVVQGVEDAADEGEVVTHEVPEDDVPGEYLDKDR